MLLFIIIWTLWPISEGLLNVLFRSGEFKRNEMDKGSMKKIWRMIAIGTMLGIASTFLINFPFTPTITIQYLGLAVILAGMIVRYSAVWTLGKFFTVDLSIAEEHKLKTNGMYKYIRHPSYAGMLLSFAGLGLSLNNVLSFVFLLIPVTAAVINRVNIEEKMLAGQFGPEYTSYAKNTRRFIPFIY